MLLQMTDDGMNEQIKKHKIKLLCVIFGGNVVY